NFIALRSVNHRSEIHSRPERIADAEAASEFNEAIDILVCYLLEHIKTLARSADLSHIEIGCPHRRAHRSLYIDVIAHYERIVASKFEIHFLDPFCSGNRYLSARGHTACESDHIGQLVAHERLSNLRSITG